MRCGTILVAAAITLVAVASQGEDFAGWVDPLIGTAGDGNCFPGPCRPFGMVQPSPDTGARTWCGGYKFTDAAIRCFSQTHLNGTGRPAMGDISILPVAESKVKVESGKFGDSHRGRPILQEVHALCRFRPCSRGEVTEWMCHG